MHAHEKTISDFYAAFAARDAAGMARCYHPDILFTDPAFPALRGAEATAMWSMLCARGKDLRLTVSGIQANADGGRAHWDAEYTFSQTGRPVLNKIDAMFAFRDGKIVRHIDRFSFWNWSRQALGPIGLLFGWFWPLKAMVRKKACASLEDYMVKNAGIFPTP